jgi:RNA polymerase sigma-70 factor, ECF subfamily
MTAVREFPFTPLSSAEGVHHYPSVERSMRRSRRELITWDAATSDEDLAGWAQRGQREAFGLLYDRHFSSVYGYCYRRLGEREAAQDAAAETFRKALAALPSYRPQAFRGWVFAIARHVVADAARQHHADLSLDDAFAVTDTGASLEEVALVQAEITALIAVLPRLSPDQHEAIAMRLAGLSPAEIGVSLGKSRGAVDMTLHRALLRLRELMGVGPEPVAGGGSRD